MATGAAGDGLFRGVFDGCISGRDMGIKRRPYHRNCGCELHKSRGNCSHSSRCINVSYPIRRSWSESCLSLAAASSGSSSYSSTCSSPASAAGGGSDLIGKKNLVRSTTDDYDDVVLFKVNLSKETLHFTTSDNKIESVGKTLNMEPDSLFKQVTMTIFSSMRNPFLAENGYENHTIIGLPAMQGNNFGFDIVNKQMFKQQVDCKDLSDYD
ncbi:hypothetical protein HAX54_045784 [Datura stramonium]|uniref:Uncharacterized protein n=1 Tax=Datura stramonium TaxID=4076 RepID=A0ABS8SQJ3_DATST|nr:hypothetical protein [Datura stramonium]